MIDASVILNNRAGLTTQVFRIPPRPPLQPLWMVAATLTESFNAEDLVGACGFSAFDTQIRAAGEVVERLALRPSGDGVQLGDVATAARVLDPADLGMIVMTEDPGSAAHMWGYRAATGERILVPQSLVDHEVGMSVEGITGLDPSPSGAAAGPTHEGAASRALLELLERDIVQRAWYTDLSVQKLQPGQELEQALSVSASVGTNLTFGVVDAPVPGVRVSICVLEDPEHEIATVGAKCHYNQVAAQRGAASEALQMRGLLLSRSGGSWNSGDPIRDEMDRASFLASSEGYRAVRAFARGFAPVGEANRQKTAVGDQGLDIDARETFQVLVAGLVAAGVDPVIVDLDSRLPRTVRSAGWHAVRALAPGLLPLRSDETVSVQWDHERYGTPVHGIPHPLV